MPSCARIKSGRLLRAESPGDCDRHPLASAVTNLAGLRRPCPAVFLAPGTTSQMAPKCRNRCRTLCRPPNGRGSRPSRKSSAASSATSLVSCIRCSWKPPQHSLQQDPPRRLDIHESIAKQLHRHQAMHSLTLTCPKHLQARQGEPGHEYRRPVKKRRGLVRPWRRCG